jgi:hypothetical protein
MNDYPARHGHTAGNVHVALDAEAGAGYSPDLPVPYTLTPQAEALLTEVDARAEAESQAEPESEPEI